MGSSIFCFAQERYTISGYVKDKSSGEDLIGAAVVIQNLEATGTIANVYGFYSITLPQGTYEVVYQYLGFQSISRTIELNRDVSMNIELSANSKELKEVVITGEREDKNLTSTRGSLTEIKIKDVKEIAVFGGEPDVMKVVELNPGIKSAGEGNSGFYVRGGGLDQNLIMLDEAIVYNPSHLLGLFSVFNGDALKDVSVYKGGMLPEYGGRTSSVMDIRMKEGNKKEYKVSGGLGLIASRLTVEGPIVKDKGSFMVSGRRTYADLFLGLSDDESVSGSQLFFYDLNVKANYELGEKDRLYLSGYFGRDRFGFNDQFGLNWGNATATLRWNHLFSNRLFSNTSLIYSNFDYEFSIGAEDEEVGNQSVIEDLSLKQDFTYYLNDKNKLKFGISSIHHTIEPGNFKAGANSGFSAEDVEERFSLESAIYLQNEWKATPILSVGYGLRYSLFNYIGDGTAYEFDDEGNQIGSTVYDDWELIETYGGFEPRLAVTYLLNEVSSVKLNYNRNYQYLHQLTNSTTSTPTDVWISSTNNVEPQIADQISIGYFRNFKQNQYETSVELYYKDMQNVIDYRNGAETFFNETVEGDLVYGDGRAFGAEFMVKKTKGDLTGWVSYTLSRTLRTFDEINDGEEFSARQDRIHDISVVALYRLNDKIKLSANFIFYTGDAVTFPTGRYTVDGIVVPLYTERNDYRMPDYHRLDLGMTLAGKKTEKFESSWSFSLYNAYGRENAFTISFQENEDNRGITEAVQTSLFRWIPSVTYNFNF